MANSSMNVNPLNTSDDAISTASDGGTDTSPTTTTPQVEKVSKQHFYIQSAITNQYTNISSFLSFLFFFFPSSDNDPKISQSLPQHLSYPVQLIFLSSWIRFDG